MVQQGIEEIYIPQSGEKCETYLFKREWEGLEPACDCRKSFHHGSKNIFKGKCSVLKIFMGCQTIHGLDKLFTNKWKGAEICVRHTETNYFDSITIIDGECPKKYTLCGVDSKNFPLCFPKKMGCPVNKIKISNSPLNNHEKKHFNSVKLSDDWILQYSNYFYNETLAIDLKYSEGRVCIDPSETNLKLNYIKYKSESEFTNIFGSANNINQTSYCSTKIGKFNYDERYKSFDSSSKFKYYFDNDIMQKIENFPHINSQELINHSVYLYQRGYLYWSPYCRKNENLMPEKIVEDLLSIVKIESYFVFAGGFLLIIFLLYVVLIISEIFYRYLGGDMNMKSEHKESYNSFFKNALSGFTILLLTFSILLIFVIFILTNHWSLVKKFNDLKCGDYFTNKAFNDVGKNLNDLFYYGAELFLGSIILCSAMILNRLIL